MRRNQISVLLISIFTAFTVFFITFVISKVLNSTQEIPLSLNENYYSINITHYDDTFSKTQIKNNESLKAELHKLFYEYDSLVAIKDSTTYKKLYLYDPSGYYSEEIINGRYFTSDEFNLNNSNKIMIYEESIYSRLIENEKLFILGNYKDVIATYPTNHTFKKLSRGYYMLQTLAADDDLIGTYYFINCDDTLINKITTLFENNGFNVSLLRTKNDSKNTSFKNIFSRREIIFMFPSLLIILFADFTFFCLLFLKNKSMINIHYNFGGRNNSIFLYLLRELLRILILGSILGGCIGSFVLFLIYKKVYFSSIVIAPLLCLILIIIIIFISFRFMKNKIVKEELR